VVFKRLRIISPAPAHRRAPAKTIRQYGSHPFLEENQKTYYRPRENPDKDHRDHKAPRVQRDPREIKDPWDQQAPWVRQESRIPRRSKKR
jgi:hypothetical protein